MHRRTVTIVLSALLLTGAVACGDGGDANPPPVAEPIPSPTKQSDPEKHSTTPVGWGHLIGTPAEINQWANRYSVRIFDVAVAGPNRFSVTGVSNVGEYQRGVVGAQSWLYDETWASLSGKLDGKRVLSLARYTRQNDVRYAAAVVDSPSSNKHDQEVWLNMTPTFLKTKIDAFGGRIADLEPVGAGRYDAVLIKNQGVDARQWWWYVQRTPNQINDLLKEHGARLVDIEPDGAGTFAVVMTRSRGEYWWWLHGVTFDAVRTLQAQSGSRYIHVKPYDVNGQTRYAVLYLDDLDPVSVKIRGKFWEALGHNAPAFGFYLKQVDGPVHNALQAETPFEPASMIKMLFHLHTMRQVFNSGDTNPSLSDNQTWYRNPSKPNDGGVCAYQDDGTPITTLSVTDPLRSVLQGMMQQSDNRKTDAVFSRFGRAAFNSQAASLGMTGTTVNHRPGCTWNAPGVVAASNKLTLADHGRLLEAVLRASNPVLGTGSYRDTFLQLSGHNLARFYPVIDEEAAKLGLGAQQVSAFRNALKDAYKPGGYANAAPGAACDQDGHCDKLLLRSTGGGALSLPAHTGSGVIYRDFVYGTFVDGVFDCSVDIDCAAAIAEFEDARAFAMREMLRPHIASALATW